MSVLENRRILPVDPSKSWPKTMSSPILVFGTWEASQHGMYQKTRLSGSCLHTSEFIKFRNERKCQLCPSGCVRYEVLSSMRFSSIKCAYLHERYIFEINVVTVNTYLYIFLFRHFARANGRKQTDNFSSPRPSLVLISTSWIWDSLFIPKFKIQIQKPLLPLIHTMHIES